MDDDQACTLAKKVNSVFSNAGVTSEGEITELLDIAECLRHLESAENVTYDRELTRTLDRKRSLNPRKE